MSGRRNTSYIWYVISRRSLTSLMKGARFTMFFVSLISYDISCFHVEDDINTLKTVLVYIFVLYLKLK
jgi:hypothetical protein